MTQAVSYGEPSLTFRKHLITRQREADGSLVLLGIPPPEREMRIDAAPGVFFCEPHHAGHDIVLARLTGLDLARRSPFIDRRRRTLAPKRMDAVRGG